MSVSPGGTFTQNISPAEDFEVSVQFRPPTETSRPLSDQVIDALKSVIRDHVTTTDGKIQAVGGPGVRG